MNPSLASGSSGGKGGGASLGPILAYAELPGSGGRALPITVASPSSQEEP